jgi:hypothetical protein
VVGWGGGGAVRRSGVAGWFVCVCGPTSPMFLMSGKLLSCFLCLVNISLRCLAVSPMRLYMRALSGAHTLQLQGKQKSV